MLSLWTHHEPDKLYTLPMDKNDPHGQVSDFLEQHFHGNQKNYSLALLVSGADYPIPVMKHNLDLDYGILLCLPLMNIHVHIQLPTGAMFKEAINPMNTVGDLKDTIHKSMSYPAEYQELLFNGRALSNFSLIMDHRIKASSKLHLFLQPSKPFSIQVKTFWGATYQMEAMPCMLVGQLLLDVLQKTFSSSASELREKLFQYKSMYSHLIIMEYNQTVLDKTGCLNQYKIKAGCVIQVMSTSETRKDNIKSMEIHQDGGESWRIKSAVYDTWFLVALRLHAKSQIPVDKMHLKINENPVNLQCTIGALRHNHIVEVKLEILDDPIVIPNTDAITVNIKFPSGISEIIRCSQRDHVKDVKVRLQTAGHKDAVSYDLFFKKVRMPPQTRLSEYKLQNHTNLELKLCEFPVYVCQGSSAFAIQINNKSTVRDLINRIQEKSSLMTEKSQLIYKGEVINRLRPDLVSLDRLGATVHSKFYVEAANDDQVLLLVTSNDVIPVKSNLETLNSQQFEKLCPNPATLIINLRWFFKWRYPQATKGLSILEKTPKSKPSLTLTKPILNLNQYRDVLEPLSPRTVDDGVETHRLSNDHTWEERYISTDDLISRITLSSDTDSHRHDLLSSATTDVSSGSLLPSIVKSSLKSSNPDGDISRKKHMTVRFELPPDKGETTSSVVKPPQKGLLNGTLTTDYYIMDSPKHGPIISRNRPERHCSSALDMERSRIGNVISQRPMNERVAVAMPRKKKSYIKYHQGLWNCHVPLNGKGIAIKGQCSILKYHRSRTRPLEEVEQHKTKSEVGLSKISTIK